MPGSQHFPRSRPRLLMRSNLRRGRRMSYSSRVILCRTTPADMCISAGCSNLSGTGLCIPGNHDDPAVMRRELRGDPFTVGGYSDFGAWRIVLLDSCLPGSASGLLSAQALCSWMMRSRPLMGGIAL